MKDLDVVREILGRAEAQEPLNEPEPASPGVCYCGPPCQVCGAITYPCGRCHLCPNCGSVDGCS